MKKIFFLLPMALFLAACQSDKKSETTETAEERIPVELRQVKTQTVADPVYLSGLVSNEKEARLSFKTGGVIQRVYVDEGDRVAAGQLLATLDLTEISAQVSQSRQGVEKARRDWERAKNLYADSVATKEQLQNANTAFEVAKENQRIADFNQKFSEIRAPHAGRIVRKLMNEGELAGPGTPIFFMDGQGEAAWVLRAGVPDRDWARIAEGDKAEVVFDAWPDEVFVGVVSNKAVAADPRSGSFEIEIKVQAKGKTLASGLFAKAKLTPNAVGQVKCVPIEALQEGNGKDAFVFITKDNQTVQKQAIRIAFINKDCVAVSQGLENVTEVITSGSPFLTERSLIKVIPTHTSAQ
ncbi:MAG: efflux RND transporter periplasmic adaptor subunit [Saprospiraceae bacterium]|nr:efflux RND transporter periplasmic adaptor subunit [Saprospiraceae bacterium]